MVIQVYTVEFSLGLHAGTGILRYHSVTIVIPHGLYWLARALSKVWFEGLMASGFFSGSGPRFSAFVEVFRL